MGGLKSYTFLALLVTIHESNNAKVSRNNTATMIFVGDISFDGPVKYFIEHKKSCDYKFLFDEVRGVLADADLRVGNLESPLLPANASSYVALTQKDLHHYGNVKAVEGLKHAGFDILQLSNNHFSDMGYKGIKSTINALEEAKISHVGVMQRGIKNKRQRPVIKTVNGIRIGFLAYCQQREGCDRMFVHGPAVFDRVIAKTEIMELRKKVDIVVVLLHWSTELLPVPTKGIRDLASSLRLLGASIIIGQHPHVVQGHECMKESLVVYSLGNFLFAKYGAKLTEFLYENIPSETEVKKYLKRSNEIFNPTQLAYIARITVSREGIEKAEYMNLKIEADKSTHCLQPKPISGHWERMCDHFDYYCYDFSTLFTTTAENLDEGDYHEVRRNDECIRRKN